MFTEFARAASRHACCTTRASMEHVVAIPERRRLVEKLLREIARAETQAIEHAPREARRLGATPPVAALQDIANHAASMQTRIAGVLRAYDMVVARPSFGTTLASLRNLVVDRVHDSERAFRAALLELRHGVDVVKLLREVAHTEELFGVIRWCDDWLVVRRPLVARVEAQLTWFAIDADVDIGIAPAPVADPFSERPEDGFEIPSPSGGHPNTFDRV